MMPSICPVFSAGTDGSNPPSATVRTPSMPQPSCTERRCASQSVSEPAVVTDSSLPFKSAADLIGAFGATTTEMLRGSSAKAATATTGEPLTANAIDGPLPKPKSTLSEASACCSFASPAMPGDEGPGSVDRFRGAHLVGRESGAARGEQGSSSTQGENSR